jgi:hypothetical protein
MEFVTKRKRDEGGSSHRDGGRTHEDVFPGLPEAIRLRLDALKKRNEYELSRKEPAFAAIVEKYQLSPDQISVQLCQAARKGKSPKHLGAIMDFLMIHYNSIMNGEPPVPLDSKFRKVPFT